MTSAKSLSNLSDTPTLKILCKLIELRWDGQPISYSLASASPVLAGIVA